MSADRQLPAVGDRIGVFYDGAQDFPANTAFYVQHGFLNGLGHTQEIGMFDFSLAIDGVLVMDGVRYVVPNPDEDTARVGRIFNFPEGLPAGTYTFNGYWYSPCEVGPECLIPNQPVLTRLSTVTITFFTP